MTVEKNYFGTDGIRGRVGGELINPEFVLKLGWAAGKAMASEGCNRVVIGKDTRISGYMLESALEAGFSAAGVNVLLTGPMPTPAIAYLTRTMGACAGVVISASHNPHHDNGIKFFDHLGQKLSDDAELAIEAKLAEPTQIVDSQHLGKAQRIDNADARYIEFCKASLPDGAALKGLKLVVDCANGAAYHIAPKVFAELGAEVISIGVDPDGVNINKDCGATDLAALQKTVVSEEADLGIALDGDADRIMMVDSQGDVVDGDEILYLIAVLRHQQGKLQGPIVGTLMSNLGLEKAIESMGLSFIREQVGDRHIIRRLLQEEGTLGGESSGHIICLDCTTTGDGIIAGLQVLGAISILGKNLDELRKGIEKYPQVLVNVPTSRMLSVGSLDVAQDHVQAAEGRLGETGRVLLRPSGTEPLVRVMVEGSDASLIEAVAQQLAEQVGQVLG